MQGTVQKNLPRYVPPRELSQAQYKLKQMLLLENP